MSGRKIKGIVLLITIIAVLVGCSSGSDSAKSIANSSGSISSSESAEAVREIALVDEGIAETSIDIPLYGDINRKIIKSGSVTIQTKTFDETINQVVKEVSDLGGFVQDSYIQGTSVYENGRSRYADITIRIPNQYFDGFINGADQFGNVLNRSMHGEDVTDEYVDIETRKRVLEIRRERLMELLEQSGTLKDLFEIEKELADVNYEIERLSGRLSTYDSLIEYATININIREVVEYTEVVAQKSFSTRLMENLRYAVRDSIRTVQNIILWGARNVIAISFWIVVLIVGVYYIKKRKLVEKIKTRKKDQNTKDKEDQQDS